MLPEGENSTEERVREEADKEEERREEIVGVAVMVPKLNLINSNFNSPPFKTPYPSPPVNEEAKEKIALFVPSND
jgi:hypothetical protein